MTPEIALLLSIVAVAVVLFALERISADVIGLGIMITLILTGLLPPEEGFAGFGSDTIMMILGLLIMTAALLRTGVVDMAGRAILRRAGIDPRRLLVVITISAAVRDGTVSTTSSRSGRR